MDKPEHYTVVIIGTGFGGTMTALSLARDLSAAAPGKPKKNILMLERGTWWTTPVGTVQDKEPDQDGGAFKFLADKHKQPVQYWPSQNHFRGVIDIVTRCLRRGRNKDGLYDLTALGPTGIFSLFRKRDGVSVLRASGVGGGSLVYSNITMRPPDLIFNDPRWPKSFSKDERDHYYNLARHAIGYGVLSALDADKDKNIPYVDKKNDKQLPPGAVNAGLSNIVTRSARLDPHWHIQDKGAPFNPRGIKQIVPHEPRKPGSTEPAIPDRTNALWIDRARVFQTAIKDSKLTNDFGAVDLAINDITPEGTPLGATEPPANYPLEKSVNYCERQGRCNVGCLPGARHTLNKQLMTAILGKPDGSAGPIFDNLFLYPLAEVDFIEALPNGGYEVHYDQYETPGRGKPTGKKRVTADNVIVSAGCMGTNEIMLRSKLKGLRNLSEKLGYGFSTNGDYIAFLENTKERVRLTRGPVTTSFGHFNTDDPGNDEAKQRFHTIEDQGIPPALASLVGVGLPLIRSLSKGRNRFLFLVWAIIFWWAPKQVWRLLSAPFKNYNERQDAFKSEDELTANMMCIAGIGRAAAVGQFRLGGPGETSLRVKRVKRAPGEKDEFHEDPVYKDLERSLDALADKLKDGPSKKFTNPFLTNVFRKFRLASITVAHPLGGCAMAEDVGNGVVDEYGRVFDRTKKDEPPEKRFYKGLYIADASIIPTALGVNPSLTISALSLRIAKKIGEEVSSQTAGS